MSAASVAGTDLRFLCPSGRTNRSLQLPRWIHRAASIDVSSAVSSVVDRSSSSHTLILIPPTAAMQVVLSCPLVRPCIP
ncbi:hypothetical protein GUJ93_ZPchr0006g40629 [Zizania palustris]|uniref:Uncharacterized protein n=1 Tax=Zizania palustris TaxID=103762 RepID=A0A8J5VX74_ZIZPA|nr:hypothetical protein GUJ93_ZPchr0006g40629 [Zizania palustris]